MNETTYKLNLDVSNVRKSASESVNSFRAIQSEAQKAGSAMDEFGDDSDGAMKKAANAVQVLKDNLTRLKTDQAQLKGLLDNAAKGVDMSKLQAEYNAITTQIQEAEKRISAYDESVKKNTTNTISLRSEMRRVREEMAGLVLAAEKEGKTLDENSGRYAQLRAEYARLTDLQGDIAAQGKQLGNDEQMFAGIVGGLQGLAGGFSAITGAVSLFAGENENLQRIMMRVQAAMSLAIGVQSVAQTLNKDSAFRLVILNKAQEWWNTAKTKAIAIQQAKTASTVKETVAQVAETAAEQRNVLATNADTASKVGQTVVTNTATVASLGFAGALRAVGIAIKSIPVIGWILAGVAALAGGVALLTKNNREAAKAQREFNKEVAENSAKPIAAIRQLSEGWNRLGNDLAAKERYIKSNSELFKQLGESINTVAEAEKLLTDPKNVQKFIQAQVAKSKVTILTDKYQKISGEIAENEITFEDKSQPRWRRNRAYFNNVDLNEELQKIYSDIEKAEGEYNAKMKELGLQGADTFAEGSIARYKQLITEKQGLIEKMTDVKEIRKAQKEIETWQKAIDKLEGKPASQAPAKEESQAEKDRKQAKEDYLQIEQKANEDLVKAKRDAEIQQTKDTKAEIENRYRYFIEDLEKQEQAYKDAKVKAGEAKTSEEVVLPAVFGQRREQAQKDRDSELQLFDLNKAQEDLKNFETIANDYIAKYHEFEELKKTANDKDKLAASGLNSEEITAKIKQEETALQYLATDLFTNNTQLQDYVSEIVGMNITEAVNQLSILQAELQNQKLTGGSQANTAQLQAKIKLLQQQLAAAQKEVKTVEKSDSPYEKWQKTYSSLTKVEKGLNEVAGQFGDVSEEAQDAVKMATTFVSSSMQMINGIATLATQSIQGTQATAVGAAGAISAVEKASVILTIISAALQIVMAIINLVKKKKAEEAAKETERIQNKIKELQKSYEELEKAIEKAYGADASNLIRQQQEILKNQKQQFEMLIAQEEARARNSNKKKEREEAEKNAQNYRDQLDEITEKQDELKEKEIDVMFGEDVKSAIDRFADYYVESFGKSNEQIKKNQKQFVKDMVKNMIMEMIKSGVSKQMETLRLYMSQALIDGISPDEEAYIDALVQQMQNSADQQMKGYEKWLRDDNVGSREAEAKGIAKASQESVDENNALLTTMVGHTRELVDLKKQMMPKIDHIGADLAQTLGVLRSIKEDTGSIRDDVSETRKDTKIMKSTLEDIRDKGIPIKK